MLTYQSSSLNDKKDNYCENLLINTDSCLDPHLIDPNYYASNGPSTNHQSTFNSTLTKFDYDSKAINCKYLNSGTSVIHTPSPSPPSLLLMKVPSAKKQSSFINCISLII